MRVVGTAGASAAAKPARGTLRPERSAAALPPSFGAHCERGLVVHRTINEGPALGRARGTYLNSPNRVGASANENQNKPNVVSSRALPPESRTRERSEMPAEFWRCGHIRGVIRQRGTYKGALQDEAAMWPADLEPARCRATRWRLDIFLRYGWKGLVRAREPGSLSNLAKRVTLRSEAEHTFPPKLLGRRMREGSLPGGPRPDTGLGERSE